MENSILLREWKIKESKIMARSSANINTQNRDKELYGNHRSISLPLMLLKIFQK